MLRLIFFVLVLILAGLLVASAIYQVYLLLQF